MINAANNFDRLALRNKRELGERGEEEKLWDKINK